MDIVHEVSVAAGHAMKSIHAGDDKLAVHKLTRGLVPEISVHSVAFEAGTTLPISCTVDGVGAPPAIGFTGIPEAAKSVVVICEDPDAPRDEPFVHWLVYGIPGTDGSVDAQTQHDYLLGKNGKSEPSYAPVAPPPGHGVHHYHFQVFALNAPLQLEAGAEREALLAAVSGHVLSWGEIVGTYERQ